MGQPKPIRSLDDVRRERGMVEADEDASEYWEPLPPPPPWRSPMWWCVVAAVVLAIVIGVAA